MSGKLTREMIEHPELWRLYMLVTPTALEVVLYTPMQEQALMYRKLPLDSAAASPVTALQDTIYDNPLLLSDFQSVTILVETNRFMMMPEELASDADARDEALRALWPQPDVTVVECGALGKLRTQRLVMAVDTHLLTFLRRTYPMGKIDHPLTPLLMYFGSKANIGTNSKMYVMQKSKGMYLMVFSRGVPLVANYINAVDIEDIVYYILATARMAGMSLTSDEVMMCGEAARRDAVSRRLRDFVKYVMPVVFPAEIYRAGKEALQAPFELVILPLCV